MLGCDSGSQAAAATSSVAAPMINACGSKTLPDCPLQGWMKSTLQTYQREKNFDRLAIAFEQLGQHGPAGFERWSDIAQAGMAAARNHDEAAVSRSCKDCHNQHRARFRRERRNVPLF